MRVCSQYDIVAVQSYYRIDIDDAYLSSVHNTQY